jgi:uncharacterized protein
MRLFLPSILLLLAAFMPALAAINFPALSGRVVDEAHILSPQATSELTWKLEDYERGTGNQLVVVTLKSLEGNDISDYGYQLGRYWQIGQKGKNNGVLLIIAPNERKVRIEVGYGLEYLLTDAASSAIINGIIIPSFRRGDMEQGIMDGTQAILDVLGGKGLPAQAQGGGGEELSGFQLLLLLLFIFLFFRFAMRHPFLAALALSSNSSRFGSSRSSGWSGFRGGGGSFGGGGASGSW